MATILEIIKNMPKGTPLFSTMHGEGNFREVRKGADFPIMLNVKDDDGVEDVAAFTKDGRYYKAYKDAECVIFPSKEVRDWSRWAEVLVKDGDIVLHKSGRVVKFDHRSMDCDDIVRFASEEEAAEQAMNDASGCKSNEVKPKYCKIFKPFDKVLVADHKTQRLIPRLFSCIQGNLFYCQDGHGYKYCIPYEGNEDKQYINV